MVLVGNKKGVHNSKLKPLYAAFLHCMNLSEYIVRVKFDRGTLAVEHNNYACKVVNVSIILSN